MDISFKKNHQDLVIDQALSFRSSKTQKTDWIFTSGKQTDTESKQLAHMSLLWKVSEWGMIQGLPVGINISFKSHSPLGGRCNSEEDITKAVFFPPAVRICTMPPFGKVFNYSQFLSGISRRKGDGGACIIYTSENTIPDWCALIWSYISFFTLPFSHYQTVIYRMNMWQ